MTTAAKKPPVPQGPTDEELFAVGEVMPEDAPVDTFPMTDEEREALAKAKADPRWVDGATVSAMIAERVRTG